MITILTNIFLGIALLTLGWFLGQRSQRKKGLIQQNVQAEQYKKEKKQYIVEQTIIVEHLSLANQTDLEHKSSTLNQAFLDNGHTVELIATELKDAQSVVDNAFGSLPNIYTCSQRTHDATKQSKEKIDALSQSVDSWQGSMQTLENIQDLIDAIHDKATQIRDVSAEANLLALNASIEAARAGDHGRGFAVVATSMRELSNKSADATLEINSAVEKTRTEVGKIINGIANSVDLLTEVSSDVSESFAEIELEVSNIDAISQTSLTEADISKERFIEINSLVNNQLESISQLLADTLGEVTGNKIEDVSVSSDFSEMKIVDVRRPDEFNGELGHINNAVLMCLQDNFEQQIQQLDKSVPHLFVCRSGGRSSRAARIALGCGFKHIFNMKGGMLEYCKVHGKPMNTQASSTIQLKNTDEVTLF